MTATPRLRSDRGSVSLLVVIFIPALVMAAGLVLDGGRQLQARRHIDQAAAAAARAAIQMDNAETYADRLDAPSAIARGEAELAARGVTGTVTVDGQTVTVATTITVDYQILPGSRTVTETATASPSQGVTTGTP